MNLAYHETNDKSLIQVNFYGFDPTELMATHVIIMYNYNVFLYPCMRYGLDTEACRANEKSAKHILKNIVYFSIKTHFMGIVHIVCLFCLI